MRFGSREPLRQNPRVFPCRSNEAVRAAAVLCAFADGINRSVVDRGQIVAHNDSPLHGQAGCFGQFRIGAYPRADDEHVARFSAAIIEDNAFDRTFAEDHRCGTAHMKVNAHLLERLPENPS